MRLTVMLIEHVSVLVNFVVYNELDLVYFCFVFVYFALLARYVSLYIC